jgi:hypothetical protein
MPPLYTTLTMSHALDSSSSSSNRKSHRRSSSVGRVRQLHHVVVPVSLCASFGLLFGSCRALLLLLSIFFTNIAPSSWADLRRPPLEVERPPRSIPVAGKHLGEFTALSSTLPCIWCIEWCDNLPDCSTPTRNCSPPAVLPPWDPCWWPAFSFTLPTF